MFFKKRRKQDVQKNPKGEKLLKTLLINDKVVGNFSNKEIFDAITNCKYILDRIGLKYYNLGQVECSRTFSDRQDFCAKAALLFITRGEYQRALQELYDCIDDYGRGARRPITSNEYTLYSCIVTCFVESLKNAI